MRDQRSILDDRTIEFDGLAITLLACGFAGVAAVVMWLIANATLRFDAGVVAAGSLAGAAVVAAWIFGYPRRAALPAMSLFILVALIGLPQVFNMDGVLLREAAGTPPGRLYVAIGLYVGGLGVAFLAFLIFGFLGPLVGAVLALRRGEKQARATLKLHGALTAAALVLTFFPRTWL